MGAAVFVYLKTGSALLDGNHIVYLTLILVAGLILYFAFVFRRDAQIVAELTRGKFEARTGKPPS